MPKTDRDAERTAEIQRQVDAMPDPTPEQIAILRRILGPELRKLAAAKKTDARRTVA